MHLVRTARSVLDKVARNNQAGGSPIHSALLASQLYEALRREMRATPRHEAMRVGLLAAAIDQCRRAAEFTTKPKVIEAELRTVLDMLEKAAGVSRTAVEASRAALRARFTVIEGGLR